MKQFIKQFLKDYRFSLIVVLLITVLSLAKMPTVPKLENMWFKNFDKVVHLCMYGGLELSLWFDYLRRNTKINPLRIFFYAFLAPILFGGVLELAQMYLTDYRGGDWMDFAADGAGVVLGALAGIFIIRPCVRLWGKRVTTP